MEIAWGVAMCHGRSHRYIPRSFRHQRVNWVCVDEDPATNPDVVGDVFDWGTLRHLGFGQYDVVLTVYCPTPTMASIIEFFESARVLLKPGGIFYFDNIVLRLIRQYDDRHRLTQSRPKPMNLCKSMLQAYLAGDDKVFTWVHSQLEALRVISGFSGVQIVPGNSLMAQFTV